MAGISASGAKRRLSPPSSRPGPASTASSLTRRPPCAPSSPGAACTASSASKSPGTTHLWTSIPTRSSGSSSPRWQR